MAPPQRKKYLPGKKLMFPSRLSNSSEESVAAEPTAMGLASSSKQTLFGLQTSATCKYDGNGQCDLGKLTYSLRVASDERLPPYARMYHTDILITAFTTGARSISTFQVCCGDMSMLSYAVDRSFPVETLEFLMAYTSFRQEDGCRITDFIEHLGSLIVCLVYRYRDRCLNEKLQDDGKRSLRLLLRAGTENSLAKEAWYDTGLYRTWLMTVFNAAAAYRHVFPNPSIPSHRSRAVAVPGVLHLVECIIERFPNEIACFWSAILQGVWKHSRITRGTLRRVADVTMKLLDLGASATIELPDDMGGSLAACIESGLDARENVDPRDDVDPYVDDVEGTIGADELVEFDATGRLNGVDWKKRVESIKRLKEKVLGYSSVDLQDVIDASLRST
ncbi:hypothetical protein LZ31DRAFT_606804 [Colletotrichum somersetense]|nr:hypothetical protein LZ31DRAFT_606804 [Colletotrichum somersetense]